MMRRVSTADLSPREYWTPGQAARVLGRGAQFWAHAFDRGEIVGYTEKTNRRGPTRYLGAASCRDYLRRLAEQRGGWDSQAFLRGLQSDPEFQAVRQAGLR